MEGPLAGVRVLEVANWFAAPAGCALLADFGADVVKVEPPDGDPLRGYIAQAPGFEAEVNYAFELPNRGKKSMTLDLRRPAARDVVYRLLEHTDVFVTNLLPGRRERYGLTYDELAERRPDLVYVSVTGYGSWGPDRDRPGYDYAAFWARSGIMGFLGEPDDPPPPQRPAMGDHTTALLVSGSVAMALLERQRTGRGQELDISLHNTGIWVLGLDIQGALVGAQTPRASRRSVPNPIWNSYRTRDDRWIMLVMLVSDMYWPRFCQALGREDLEADARFATLEARNQNREALIALLDGLFAERTLEQWAARLDERGCIWAPAQTVREVLDDPQLKARQPFATVPHPVAGEMEIIDTPVKFKTARVGARGAAPELGQNTEEVLLAAGYGWDDITRLREDGVI
jgi:formyl-CoA transferase